MAFSVLVCNYVIIVSITFRISRKDYSISLFYKIEMTLANLLYVVCLIFEITLMYSDILIPITLQQIRQHTELRSTIERNWTCNRLPFDRITLTIFLTEQDAMKLAVGCKRFSWRLASCFQQVVIKQNTWPGHTTAARDSFLWQFMCQRITVNFSSQHTLCIQFFTINHTAEHRPTDIKINIGITE